MMMVESARFNAPRRALLVLVALLGTVLADLALECFANPVLDIVRAITASFMMANAPA